MTTPTDTPLLHKCPKCGEMALEVCYRHGYTDHGEIEGEQMLCHNCGYEDEWTSRC